MTSRFVKRFGDHEAESIAVSNLIAKIRDVIRVVDPVVLNLCRQDQPLALPTIDVAHAI